MVVIRLEDIKKEKEIKKILRIQEQLKQLTQEEKSELIKAVTDKIKLEKPTINRLYQLYSP